MQRAMHAASLLHDVEPGLLAELRAEEKGASQKHMTTTLRMGDGSSRAIHLHRTFRPHYRDEYTNEQLPQAWVRDATKDELD